MKNTVIIFDDNTEILQICSIILEAKGFRVVTETSCENVIEKIMSASAHVVMMDNIIPQTGGMEATQVIKKTTTTSHIPVIFSSASQNVATLSQQAGAEYFLEKPFDISQLEDTIRLALDKRLPAAC